MFHSVRDVPHVCKWDALPACNLLAGILFKRPASTTSLQNVWKEFPDNNLIV
ncbi:hypothetical protein [Mucilaginibacter flavidus]|uniref:hypothetical protein n=1 Tax=Mucilaginibacter flavidus TaxID=2949309 RepID=UPI0020920CFF|nr:hypothetical protein [Mucilaginibacter flavidus]